MQILRGTSALLFDEKKYIFHVRLSGLVTMIVTRKRRKRKKKKKKRRKKFYKYPPAILLVGFSFFNKKIKCGKQGEFNNCPLLSLLLFALSKVKKVLSHFCLMSCRVKMGGPMTTRRPVPFTRQVSSSKRAWLIYWIDCRVNKRARARPIE